jgi:hypothetical protein
MLSGYSSRQYWSTPAAFSDAGFSVEGRDQTLGVDDGRDLLLHPSIHARRDDAIDPRRLDLRTLLRDRRVDDDRGHRLKDLVARVVGQHRGLGLFMRLRR